jgi:hypothetical protein
VIYIYFKIHSDNNKKVLAIADENLIGKTLKEKEIEFNVSSAFYKGEKADEKKIAILLKEHSNINIIGKKAVSIALKEGLIKKENIIFIKKIPHAQIYFI